MKDRFENELKIGDFVSVGEVVHIDDAAKVALVKFPDDTHVSGWQFYPRSIAKVVGSVGDAGKPTDKVKPLTDMIAALNKAGAIVTCSIDVKA